MTTGIHDTLTYTQQASQTQSCITHLHSYPPHPILSTPRQVIRAHKAPKVPKNFFFHTIPFQNPRPQKKTPARQNLKTTLLPPQATNPKKHSPNPTQKNKTTTAIPDATHTATT
jgi:hypothetical protein